jgi:hypothetical protein
MLNILLGESFMRKVGKKGIRLNGALYQHVKLAPFVGEDVRLMTDDDMGIVYVYEMNHAPICIAEDYDWSGKSRAELAEGKRMSHRIAREMAKLAEEWEETSRRIDPTIKDRIEAAAFERGRELPVFTPAVAKSTPAIRAVMDNTFAEQDEAALEASNIMDMQGEKLLPSGRPAFARRIDRFIWDLENEMVDESTNRLANKYPDEWEIGKREYERKKIG